MISRYQQKMTVCQLLNGMPHFGLMSTSCERRIIGNSIGSYREVQHQQVFGVALERVVYIGVSGSVGEEIRLF